MHTFPDEEEGGHGRCAPHGIGTLPAHLLGALLAPKVDLVPNGSFHVLSTGKPTESPHVGLGFDNQIIVWGYDRNAYNGSN